MELDNACITLSKITVKPSLTATSRQQPPLYIGRFFCPGRQYTHWLLFKPVYNSNGHESVSPIVKITYQQQPAFSSATDEKVKNGHKI